MILFGFFLTKKLETLFLLLLIEIVFLFSGHTEEILLFVTCLFCLADYVLPDCSAHGYLRSKLEIFSLADQRKVICQ